MSGDDDDNDTVLVECGTTAGDFTMILHRSWSPHGFDRATELFKRGFYDNSHFFRVVPNFLVQFGMSYTKDRDLQAFANSVIQDDPQLNPRIQFEEGVISFAGSGPNSRTSHLFVAYGPYQRFGEELWETPIGIVADGMDTLRKLYAEYGDMPPYGKGPEQHKIHQGGEKYMEQFPLMDRFKTCSVIDSSTMYDLGNDNDNDDDYDYDHRQSVDNTTIKEESSSGKAFAKNIRGGLSVAKNNGDGLPQAALVNAETELDSVKDVSSSTIDVVSSTAVFLIIALLVFIQHRRIYKNSKVSAKKN